MLWDYTFEKIYAYMDENDIEYALEFERPGSVLTAEYCTMSGHLVTEACKNDAMHILSGGASCVATGYFTLDTLPSIECTTHVAVNWDSETQAVCMPGCDCDSVITLGFRHVPSRIFLRQVTVTDAQFTYRDIPVGYEYPIDPTMPFYDNLAGTYMEYDEDLEEEIEKRYYFGTSGTDLPFNRICLEHLKFVDDDDEEPSEESEEIPWWEW